MNRFDQPHVVERDMQAVSGQIAQLSAVESGDAPRLQSFAISPFDGIEHVGAVAAAADGDPTSLDESL